jgi:hypothetical protein
MPLVRDGKVVDGALARIEEAPVPETARAGLYLYAGLWDAAHETAQDIADADGSFWHAIVHRQEPDTGNASYWFRQVGSHPIFPALAQRAAEIEPAFSGAWDPFAFVKYCERAAAQPGSENERRALAIQRAEWELLFAHCLRTARRG